MMTHHPVVAEDGFGRRHSVQETTCRVGKVIKVHRENYTVDIAPMDGPILMEVPVLSGVAASTFGASLLGAPSYDKEVEARKTYPAAAGEVVDPATNAGSPRDVYCVYTQLGASAVGMNGHVVLGFLYGMVSEMLFDGKTHPDLWVVRTPSDVQITIDAAGKVSVQHPSGARITIGTDFAATNLAGADFDKRYALKNNTGAKVGIELIDTEGSRVTLDHEGKVKVHAPVNVEVDAGEDIKMAAGSNIKGSAGSNVEWDAGMSFKAHGSLQAKLSADAITRVSADGLTRVSGALTLISGDLIIIGSLSGDDTGEDQAGDPASGDIPGLMQ